MKNISLLGSTGSIGRNTLDVVRQFSDAFRVCGLSAGSNIELLARQIQEFQPLCVSVADKKLVAPLAEKLGPAYEDRIYWGDEGNCKVASIPETDMVVTAVVGAVGLLPTMEAIRAGKDIGLANKETLVMAGELMMDAVAKYGVSLLPIDSEHSAIFQALEAGRRQDVARIILTASGGPFRTRTSVELESVTPAQALAHPNWDMGDKISIDSATLINKGLEVIEARWLFGVTPDQISVVVHPQSIVHSLVEYIDGSVVAQLGIPDMRIPIAYALSYPERMPLGLSRLSLAQCGRLDFEAPDYERFPALQMAFDVLRQGGTGPCVLNAANEVAVAAFLAGSIRFLDIPAIVKDALEKSPVREASSIDIVLEADAEARKLAKQHVERLQQAQQ